MQLRDLLVIFAASLSFFLFPSKKDELKIPENIARFVIALNNNLPENLGSVIQDAYIDIGKDITAGQTRKQGINKFFNEYLENQQENNKKSIFAMKGIISSIAFNNKGLKQYYQKLFGSIIMYDFIKINEQSSSDNTLKLLTKLFSGDVNMEDQFSVEKLYLESYKTIFGHRLKNGDVFDAHYYVAKINNNDVDDLDISIIQETIKKHNCLMKITNVDYEDKINKSKIMAKTGLPDEKHDENVTNKNNPIININNKTKFLPDCMLKFIIFGIVCFVLYKINQKITSNLKREVTEQPK